MRSRTLVQYIILALLFAFFGLFMLYPIWLTVRDGFSGRFLPGGEAGFTLEHIRIVFLDPAYRRGLVNAFSIAIVTTLLCILIALPLAVLSANYRYPGKQLWNAAILVPLILPPFVGAIGLRAILGRFGALNTVAGIDVDWLGTMKFWGVVIAQALHLYPIIYLNATAALANLDPALDEAAENLGASPIRRFLRVTLPLIRPGLFAGGTIVFIWSFTELGTPLMFGMYDVTPVQIFDGLENVETSAVPYALTVVMLTTAIMAYAMGKLAFGGRAHAMQTRASRAGEEVLLGGAAKWGAAALFGVVTFVALLPHMGVVLASLSEEGAWYQSILPERFTLENYDSALSHELAVSSIRNSLFYATLAVIIDVGLGILIGYLLVRSRVRGRGILDALSMLPLAVPGLVLAFGFVAMTLHWPFDGDLVIGPITIPPLLDGINVVGANPNPVPLLIVAYAVRRLPYVVRATVAGLEQTSGELEEAAHEPRRVDVDIDPCARSSSRW